MVSSRKAYLQLRGLALPDYRLGCQALQHHCALPAPCTCVKSAHWTWCATSEGTHLLSVRCVLSSLFGKQHRKVPKMLLVCSFPCLQLLELLCQQVNLAVQKGISLLLCNKADFSLFKPEPGATGLFLLSYAIVGFSPRPMGSL